MPKSSTDVRFAMCVKNDDCEDLELRKIYRILPDKRAEGENYLRVVDESGDDYLYPDAFFVFVRLPKKAQEAVGNS